MSQESRFGGDTPRADREEPGRRKPRFEDLWVDLQISIDPYINREIGLPSMLSVRRGMSHPRGYADFDQMVELMTWELRSGLRALKHKLQMGGYVEMDSDRQMEIFREQYLEGVADELREAGYEVIHKSEIDPDYGP